jgi:hypothetical protein
MQYVEEYSAGTVLQESGWFHCVNVLNVLVGKLSDVKVKSFNKTIEPLINVEFTGFYKLDI